MRAAVPLACLLLAACGAASSQPSIPAGTKADRLLVDKSDRVLIAFAGNREIVRYTHIRFGDAPTGHKQFEGDGKTPEGLYFIDRLNPNSRSHLSVGISYPSAQDVAEAAMLGLRPGGDIFIHGLGPEGRALNKADWTAGCIAVTDEEIEEIFAMLRPGVPIFINP